MNIVGQQRLRQLRAAVGTVSRMTEGSSLEDFWPQ
jgi:hypothetical protein